MAYSPERRAAVIARILPPNRVPLTRLAKEEGIALGTLMRWRDDARRQGHLLPAADRGPDNWSSRDKFAAVVEAVALNETDLAEYCRRRGLLPEHIRAWRAAGARQGSCRVFMRLRRYFLVPAGSAIFSSLVADLRRLDSNWCDDPTFPGSRPLT